MMMSTTSALRVTGVLSAVAVLVAATLEAQHDRPSFRSSARLVELGVIVTARDRNPVTGLTANDFQIFDDGKPQKAFLNSNDIRGAIRRAADDARMTYVLGYYPTSDVWDGRFHRISVKVNRSGVEVRHRKGYFAVATQKQAAAQRAEALKAAVSSPINASGIGLRLRIDPVEGKPSDYRLSVHVQPAGIALEPAGDESRGAIDVVVAQVRADGAEGRSLDHTVDIRAAGERLQQFLRDGTTFTHTVMLHPEAHRLRIVVRDVRTGALGAIGVSREQLLAIPR